MSQLPMPYRDKAIVAAKLKENLQFSGKYTCEDCKYQPDQDDFVISHSDTKTIMEISKGILDVHHKLPVKEGERTTSLDDLRVICPLCHRRRHVLNIL